MRIIEADRPPILVSFSLLPPISFSSPSQDEGEEKEIRQGGHRGAADDREEFFAYYVVLTLTT